MKWFLDGEPIPNGMFLSSIIFNYIYIGFVFLDEHFQVQTKGPVHTLTIRKVAWNEGGEYKCIADGGAKTSATLIVKGILIYLRKEITSNILSHRFLNGQVKIFF